MSDENAKLISSIHRGVDGKNIDYGLKNFALVGLFIDYVDYYDLEKDKRFIYQLDENHQWFEQEVCPRMSKFEMKQKGKKNLEEELEEE